MAIYTYRCVKCDRREEVVQSISSYCKAPHVPVCIGNVAHGKMERYLTAPMVSFDTAPWAAYRSPVDGSVITGRREQREHMARHNLALYDEVAPDIERAKKANQKELVEGVKKDMIQAVEMLNGGYKPQLAKAEVEGADVNVVTKELLETAAE